MTNIEAVGVFKKLLKETNNKRETKIYKSFIDILSNIESRGLSNDELLMIQKEIDALNLKANHENKVKYFNKKLKNFKVYLKENFSLVSEGYYTAMWMSLGMCFCVAMGTGFGVLGSSTGIAIGMLIGIAIGKTKDMEAEKQNRVLK